MAAQVLQNPGQGSYARLKTPGGRVSAREREVLVMLALGATREEIAELLFISPQTVRTHISNIRGRLGARNQAHAVLLALESGELRI